MAVATPIHTDRFSSVLRERGVDKAARRVLLTRLTGSEQEKDLTKPTNCEGFGRIRHFSRETAVGWPPNPLPIDPAAKALGVQAGEAGMRAQVFQNAVCNWRCWYCYVDFPLLSGNPKHSAYLSAEEMLELYLAEDDRALVIDLSGGQPDLVPEWIPWTMNALNARDLAERVFLWSDDNLSNDYFWTKLTPAERRMIDGFHNYGKVCCFKGFDARSFAFNTGAAPEVASRQFELMRRLVADTTIDLYAYVTFTTDDDHAIDAKVVDFVDRLQEIAVNLPLRTIPLRVAAFTPTRGRMDGARERAIELQDQAAAAWVHELESRFSGSDRARRTTDVSLR